MGNGSRIRFWEYIWCDDVVFSNCFVDLYRLSMAKIFSISKMLVAQFGSTPYGWDLHFHRNLHERELDNYVNLTTLLDTVHLHEDMAHSRICIPNNSRGFSSKSAFAALQQEDGFMEFRFFKFICKSCIPVRVKFFAWSLSLEKINTSDVL